jgi:hypothetical protein
MKTKVYAEVTGAADTQFFDHINTAVTEES